MKWLNLKFYQMVTPDPCATWISRAVAVHCSNHTVIYTIVTVFVNIKHYATKLHDKRSGTMKHVIVSNI